MIPIIGNITMYDVFRSNVMNEIIIDDICMYNVNIAIKGALHGGHIFHHHIEIYLIDNDNNIHILHALYRYRAKFSKKSLELFKANNVGLIVGEPFADLDALSITDGDSAIIVREVDGRFMTSYSNDHISKITKATTCVSMRNLDTLMKSSDFISIISRYYYKILDMIKTGLKNNDHNT